MLRQSPRITRLTLRGEAAGSAGRHGTVRLLATGTARIDSTDALPVESRGSLRWVSRVNCTGNRSEPLHGPR